jgi:hypothetical protein
MTMMIDSIKINENKNTPCLNICPSAPEGWAGRTVSLDHVHGTQYLQVDNYA